MQGFLPEFTIKIVIDASSTGEELINFIMRLSM
jgi:hypothetical protein